MGKQDLVIPKGDYDAVIFDMDGVVTRTAAVHSAAWRRMFDEYREESGGQWKPFDPDEDYTRHLDGKPRYEGTADFLASRGIELPLGDRGDDPSEETVCGLGNRKNAIFQELIRSRGVTVYESGVALVKRLRENHFETAVVSSSKNCAMILEAAGVSGLFQVRVGGVESEEMNLKGKPAPDIFLEAARRLQVGPGRAVVVEDALSGVEAGRRGGFGLVIGVDRSGHGRELRESGAHVVVKDLSTIRIRGARGSLPHAIDSLQDIRKRFTGSEPAFFLDYDGTLTPIVRDPTSAHLPEGMRRVVQHLSEHRIVAVISGRDLHDVMDRVGVEGIFYAGSHGFDIAGPGGRRDQKGTEFLPALDAAETRLKSELEGIEGALVERKRFSIAVHYRNVRPKESPGVEQTVDRILGQVSGLRKSPGRKVFDIKPDIEWHKGKALFFLLDTLGVRGKRVVPLYLGDDTTDEDAFRAVRGRGLGIVVMDKPRPTSADYYLRSPEEVRVFLEAMTPNSLED